MYPEFVSNPIVTVFIAAKRDHKFQLNQRSNKSNISSNSINFGLQDINEKSVAASCSTWKYW